MRHLGFFRIPDKLIVTKKDDVHNVMALLKLIPYKVEHNFMARHIECGGLSPLFEDVPKGVEPPNYSIEVTKIIVDGEPDYILKLTQVAEAWDANLTIWEEENGKTTLTSASA